MQGSIFWKLFNMYLDSIDKPLEFVATSDIGWFAAQSLLNPEDPTYANQAIGLAGDKLTMKEMKEGFKRVNGGKEFQQGYWILAKMVTWFLGDVRGFCLSTFSSRNSLEGLLTRLRCTDWTDEGVQAQCFSGS